MMNDSDEAKTSASPEGEQDEDELRKSEARYRALFETAQDGIMIVNDQGYYVEVNDSLCRILKTTREIGRRAL
jgi:PAS domain-containing protein